MKTPHRDGACFASKTTFSPRRCSSGVAQPVGSILVLSFRTTFIRARRAEASGDPLTVISAVDSAWLAGRVRGAGYCASRDTATVTPTEEHEGDRGHR
jgi:hypothetical protein